MGMEDAAVETAQGTILNTFGPWTQVYDIMVFNLMTISVCRSPTRIENKDTVLSQTTL